MREQIFYVADNGKQFDNKEECLQYEQKHNELMTAIHKITSYCKECGCEDCFFLVDNECIFVNTPNYWEGELERKAK